MPKYLTVSQYKRIQDGVSLSGISDMNLAYAISRAEASIDAHFGFDAKRGGFEPHTVMIQQKFNESSRKTFMPFYHTPVRNITRYRIQVSNISTSGAGFFANINAGDCVINNDDEYIEIVPLQAVTYSLSPIILELGLKPPIVEMDCEVGYYIPVTGEELMNGGQGTTYYATDGFWASSYDQALATQPNTLPPVPPVVYANGAVVNAANYTVNYTDGSVTFNSVQLPTVTVTADYTKTIPDYVTEACIIQTSYLLQLKHLNEMGVYKGMYQFRNGEQEISFPRVTPFSALGRQTATSLCPDALGVLSRYDDWSIA
jgi:hypothetical protein